MQAVKNTNYAVAVLSLLILISSFFVCTVFSPATAAAQVIFRTPIVQPQENKNVIIPKPLITRPVAPTSIATRQVTPQRTAQRTAQGQSIIIIRPSITRIPSRTPTPLPTFEPTPLPTRIPTLTQTPAPTQTLVPVGTQVDVIPYLECVYDLKDGTYLAYFGYDNLETEPVFIPPVNTFDVANSIMPAFMTQNQVTKFFPGRHYAKFVIRFNGQPFEWRLGVQGSPLRTAKVTINSRRCSSVEPYLECITEVSGEFKAVFGYLNPNPFEVRLPIGYQNKFSPAPIDRSQPTEFLSGRVNNVFSTTFKNNSSYYWKLGNIYLNNKVAPDCQDAIPTGPEGLGCSTTSTAETLIQTNRLLSALFNSTLNFANSEAKLKAKNLLEKAQVELLSWPKELINCEDLKYCTREDLYERNQNVIDLTTELHRLTVKALRQGARDSAAGRRAFSEARRAYKTILELIGESPRFTSVCS